MKYSRKIWLTLTLALLFSSAGCAPAFWASTFGIGLVSSTGYVQANSRGPEELYLGMGEAHYLFSYADSLLYQGRYREAATAYLASEHAAYTNAVREAARTRRFYVQQLIAAYENGQTPMPPPVITAPPNGGHWVPPMPRYGEQIYQGSDKDMSVVSINLQSLDPKKDYYQNEANYHLYGYPNYPGDIKFNEIRIPPYPAKP